MKIRSCILWNGLIFFRISLVSMRGRSGYTGSRCTRGSGNVSSCSSVILSLQTWAAVGYKRCSMSDVFGTEREIQRQKILP